MKKVLQIAGGILFFAGFFLLVWGFDDTAPAFRQPVDIYENTLKKVPRYASVDSRIDWLYACVGTVTTKTTNESGVSYKGTDYYYIVPFEIGEEEYYVALEVSDKNRKAYDRIVDSTWNYIEGKSDRLTETQHFTGVVARLNGRIYQYMCEYFEGVFEEDEIEKYVLPYVLKSSDLERNKRMTVIAFLLLTVGAAIFLTGFFVKGKRLPEVSEGRLGYVLEEIPASRLKLMLQSGFRFVACGVLFLVDFSAKKNELLSAPVVLETLMFLLVTAWPFLVHAKEKAVLYQNGMSVAGESFLLEDAGDIRFRGTSVNGLFRRNYMDTGLKTFDITLFPDLEGKYYGRYVKSVL